MKIECRIGVLSQGLEGLGVLQNLNGFVAQHYRAASNRAIELDCKGPFNSRRQLPSNSPATALQLHEALVDVTKNPIRGPVSRIGVLLAHSYRQRTDAFGIMFDRGFTTPDDPNAAGVFTLVPREGCAIFIGAIQALRGTGEDFVHEVFFTTVHELGHVFNLLHEYRWPNFMLSSDKNATYGPSAFRFDANQQGWLSRCRPDNLYVMPGGMPFGDRGPSGNMDSPRQKTTSSSSFGLELSIDCTPREFWRFEPVQLEIGLRKIGGEALYQKVPDELDPGYKSFRIMIEEPNGERRLYRSTKHFCGAPGFLKITTGKPFRRDLAIFGQSGGYTFKSSGVHRLWAEFDTKKGVLRSNKLEIFIKPEHNVDDERDLYNKYLSNPRASKVLFHREDLSDGKGIRILKECMDSFPKAWSTGEIHYTLGKAIIVQAESNAKSASKQYLKASEHIKRALDFKFLGEYRRQKSIEILDELSQR